MRRTIAIAAVLAAFPVSAYADDADDDEDESSSEEAPAADEPAPAPTKPAKRWSIAVGPSVWAASIDASVALGPVRIGTNVPFAQIAQYLDGGVSGTVEARYERFTLSGDFTYGTLSASTSQMLGPAMANAKASVTSTLVEASLGYDIVGGSDDARLSLAIRPGFRYSGLDVVATGMVDVFGTTIGANAALGQGGTDYLIGGRARVRVNHRLAFTVTGDVGIAGYSDATWSLAGEANVRVFGWLGIVAGWRVLETVSGPITQQQNGPQIAFLFGF